MFTVDEIREKLSDRNIAEVARRTGLEYAVVYRIATGKTPNPTYATAKVLVEYLTDGASA